jgi:flagellar motor component MotA
MFKYDGINSGATHVANAAIDIRIITVVIISMNFFKIFSFRKMGYVKIIKRQKERGQTNTINKIFQWSSFFRKESLKNIEHYIWNR